MGTTKKGSRYQRDRAIAENAYATLYAGMDLKTRQPVLIRSFKPEMLSSEEDWAGFRHQLDERRQLQVPGMLRAAGVAGNLTHPYLVTMGTTGQSLRNALKESADHRTEALVEALGTAAGALDELHALGYVHGDVRPDTLFFNPQGELCLNEICSHYALCGWTQQSHEMNPQFFGAVSLPHIAPEIRQGGPLTERTDQYALGLVLLELFSGQLPRDGEHIQHLIDGQGVPAEQQTQLTKLRPVFARVLSEDPARRYASCRELLEDVERQLDQAPASKWILMGVGISAALVLLILLLKLMIGGGEPATEDDGWKVIAAEEIAKRYQVAIDPIPSQVAAARFPAQGMNAVAPILEEYQNEQAIKELGSLKSLLERVSLEPIGQPDSKSFSFLYTLDSATVLPFAEEQPAGWKVHLNFSDELPDKKLDVRVELFNADLSKPRAELSLNLEGTKSLLPKDKLSWDAGQNLLTVDLGEVASPKNDQAKPWEVGMGFYAKVFISGTKNPILWQRSPVYHVGKVDRIDETISLVPSEVRDNGYQIDTKIQLAAGQEYTLMATGRIQPGTEGSYQVMTGKKDREKISPYGLATKAKGKRYPVSDDNKLKIKNPRWGALLMKIGTDADWAWPDPQAGAGDLAITKIAEHEGRLYLSIDSVKYEESRELKRDRVLVEDYRFWETKENAGEFQVTIQSTKFFPVDLPAKVSEKLLNRFQQE